MKILITGSEGLMGKIISKELEKENQLVRIDRQLGIDILTTNLSPYFTDVEALIHLAANPSPFISQEEAQENIEIAKRVIEACRNSGSIRRIINASSINVYPYIDIFESGQKLTSNTQLSQNTRWANGYYGRAKIQVEKMFEDYCKANRISLLNLRIGCVTKDNLPNKQKDGHVESIDYDIHLKYEDLISIIETGLKYKGIDSYVCVSKREGFVDESIRFPV